ncbi:D-alanyl-D-alanine carboxypeptidase [Pseudanabaena sp. PCC 6802]|uniref:D-alanyl-D-alanine carboxypeptidase n=1 Tax=Pseudanabaena sp. PCC 6802 TaxID=118173 RepID=UPI00034C9793|nr:D-alanyl-D-alanine carboxypeptidase [Pseudanabaena sp. PCC 6802]
MLRLRKFGIKNWLYRIAIALTAMLVAVGWSHWSKDSAIAQVALKRTEVNSPELVAVRSGFCQSSLEAAIESIIGSPEFTRARWGIQIEPLSDPTVLYSHNGDLPLIPASNVKLLTTAAALRIIDIRTPQDLSTVDNLVTEINRESDNELADYLLRHIGGRNVVKQLLASIGVSANSYEQVDGSGLSRSNRAEPSTFIALLKAMHAQNLYSGMFYHSLSVAGVNGTLRNRFRNTFIQGRVHAKTGTLNGVRALSGYLDNLDYGALAFSIMVNQPGQSGQVMVDAIDRIVLNAAQVSRCS